MIQKLHRRKQTNSPNERSKANSKKAVGNRPKILIEMASDGFIRVFGSDDVDVLAINRPHCATAENAVLSEQLVEAALPLEYSSIYEANQIKTTALVKKITPCQIQDRVWQTQLYEAIDDRKTPEPQIIKRILEE